MLAAMCRAQVGANHFRQRILQMQRYLTIVPALPVINMYNHCQVFRAPCDHMTENCTGGESLGAWQLTTENERPL